MDLKSNGVSPRRFESCRLRNSFCQFLFAWVARCAYIFAIIRRVTHPTVCKSDFRMNFFRLSENIHLKQQQLLHSTSSKSTRSYPGSYPHPHGYQPPIQNPKIDLPMTKPVLLKEQPDLRKRAAITAAANYRQFFFSRPSSKVGFISCIICVQVYGTSQIQGCHRKQEAARGEASHVVHCTPISYLYFPLHVQTSLITPPQETSTPQRAQVQTGPAAEAEVPVPQEPSQPRRVFQLRGHTLSGRRREVRVVDPSFSWTKFIASLLSKFQRWRR